MGTEQPRNLKKKKRLMKRRKKKLLRRRKRKMLQNARQKKKSPKKHLQKRLQKWLKLKIRKRKLKLKFINHSYITFIHSHLSVDCSIATFYSKFEIDYTSRV